MVMSEEHKRPYVMKKKRLPCPKCGLTKIHDIIMKRGKWKGILFIDWGWKCSQCGYEWGFTYDFVTSPDFELEFEGLEKEK